MCALVCISFVYFLPAERGLPLLNHHPPLRAYTSHSQSCTRTRTRTHMHASLRPRILLWHRLPDNLPFSSISLSQLLDARAIEPAFFLPRSRITRCVWRTAIFNMCMLPSETSFSHLLLSRSVQIVRVRFDSCWIACACKIFTHCGLA